MYIIINKSIRQEAVVQSMYNMSHSFRVLCFGQQFQLSASRFKVILIVGWRQCMESSVKLLLL